jgi:hypothetical protein
VANERLRSTIVATGQTYETVAGVVGVDPKTVERWVTVGRPPHRRHRWATAQLLDVDEAYLWPAVLKDPLTQAASQAEFVHLYPTRGAVPGELWRGLTDGARDSLDFFAFAALFLPDTDPDFAGKLAAKAAAGCRVRILLGDPDGTAIAQRGDEEGIGAGLAERVRITLSHLAPLAGVAGVEIRLHNVTLYASIFRSDAAMLVNTHVYGSPAAANPVLHLQRVAGGRMYDTYQRSFERAWDEATPYVAAKGTRRRR